MTPANACPMNDGAAAMLVTTAERAEKLGLKPLGAHPGLRLQPASARPTWASARPIALPKALARAGLKYDQLDLVELNEAFAAQSLAVGKKMAQDGHGWDWDKTNVNGGAIALGHPVGQSGARIVGHAAARDEAPQRPVRRGHALRRRRPGRGVDGGTSLARSRFKVAGVRLCSSDLSPSPSTCNS